MGDVVRDHAELRKKHKVFTWLPFLLSLYKIKYGLMSRSYHVNITHLRGYSKKAIDEMFNDPDSILSQRADKRHVKNSVKRARIIQKQRSRILKTLG